MSVAGEILVMGDIPITRCLEGMTSMKSRKATMEMAPCSVLKLALHSALLLDVRLVVSLVVTLQ